MRLNDTNIFFDKTGQPIMNIGRNAEFCAFGSTRDMCIEAPAIIAADVKLDVGYIGAFTAINPNTSLRFVESIGRFCSIAPECRIGLPVHPINTFSHSDIFYAENRWKYLMNSFAYDEFEMNRRKILNESEDFDVKIIIGNDVWIGQGVKIINNVTIGDGAVIGAGAVVTKDVEPYTIVGGVPAKVIRKRFSDDIIEKLLELKWWEYGPDILQGIDITSVTHEQIDKIKEKIASGKFSKINPVKCKFSNRTQKIYRIEEDNTYVLYDDNINEIKMGGISGERAQYNAFTGQLSLFGWFLPSCAYDEIKIYEGSKYLGNADIHCLRKDVAENFKEFGDARSGWKFNKILKNYSGSDLTLCCMKKGNIIHKINKISCRCVNPANLLNEYLVSFNSSLIFNKNENICIVADNLNSENDIKNCFKSNYNVVGKKTAQKAVICTADWKNDIIRCEKEDKEALPFWLWLVCDKNMINYNKLKSVCAEMHIETGEMLCWIKKHYKKEIVLVYANCQNISINTLITSSNTLMQKYILIDMLPVQDIKGDELKSGFKKDFLNAIDLFIYQNVSVNNRFSPKLATSEILKNIDKHTKTICIPNVYFTGYFPQVCANPYNPFIKEYNNTPFPYGDINIQNMEEKYSAKEIADIIGAEDFYSAEDCIKNAEASLNELIEREKLCDVKISDYIRDNYKKKCLFFTSNHPANIVLEELVRRVFKTVGISADDIDTGKAWENSGREIFIYPSVKKGLNLEFKKEKFCWWNVLKAEPSDIYEYVSDYLKYCSKSKYEE